MCPGATGLGRFVDAQAGGVYEHALSELRSGQKRSHWMWFIFPQIAGLGRSSTAKFFSARDLEEARAYLANEVLGARIIECTHAMLAWAGKRSASAVLGPIDALKFCSSMTLFEAAAGQASPFTAAIEAFCGGKRDQLTLARL